jgi:hypothetical protein
MWSSLFIVQSFKGESSWIDPHVMTMKNIFLPPHSGKRYTPKPIAEIGCCLLSLHVMKTKGHRYRKEKNAYFHIKRVVP